MHPPTFSVATPTRNALDKLRRCVGSVRGQAGSQAGSQAGGQPGVHCEHLVQDANSSDGTPQWLAARQGPYLQSVSEADTGMYDAINRAWSRAGGRYLSWLNADEQYLPGTLARVQAFFEAHPRVDVLFGDYLVADPQGRAVALRREVPLRRWYVVNSFLNAQSCTLFYRRELWDRGLLRLDSRLRYAADKALVLHLLDEGARFHHLPEVLSVFGIDGSNLSTHRGMEQEAEAVRLAHGAYRWRPLRAAAIAGRRIERLLRGAYRTSDLHYRYAIDEVPNYVEYFARGLGGRYSLQDTQGRAQIVATPAMAGQPEKQT